MMIRHPSSHSPVILVHASTDPLGEMEARLMWVITGKKHYPIAIPPVEWWAHMVIVASPFRQGFGSGRNPSL
jgi:hypothetical protein